MNKNKFFRFFPAAIISAMLMVSFSAAAKIPTCAVGQNPLPWSAFVPLAGGTKKEKRQHKRRWKKLNRCKLRCKQTPTHAGCPVASVS